MVKLENLRAQLTLLPLPWNGVRSLLQQLEVRFLELEFLWAQKCYKLTSRLRRPQLKSPLKGTQSQSITAQKIAQHKYSQTYTKSTSCKPQPDPLLKSTLQRYSESTSAKEPDK